MAVAGGAVPRSPLGLGLRGLLREARRGPEEQGALLPESLQSRPDAYAGLPAAQGDLRRRGSPPMRRLLADLVYGDRHRVDGLLQPRHGHVHVLLEGSERPEQVHCALLRGSLVRRGRVGGLFIIAEVSARLPEALHQLGVAHLPVVAVREARRDGRHGDGDDDRADDHCDARDGLAQAGAGYDIAVPNSCDCGHGPPHRSGDRRKLASFHLRLYCVDERGAEHGRHSHEEDEDEYAFHRLPDALENGCERLRVPRGLREAQHPQEPDHAYQSDHAERPQRPGDRVHRAVR
mmetsp:Transcript_46841/g.146761  ORF Transcript_46841/g.146761 Transcript_46841/m.146761 type:complete len:291 (+) Transcript_46841:278-1150(+)